MLYDAGKYLLFGTGLFGLAVSVTGHFGQTMKSCRNLTLMQSRAV